MMRPVLLDLFCGAGGAAKGYHDAGFDVVGVDHKPQPRYPYEFIQADAIEYLATHGNRTEWDAIHASPPCQGYSRMRHLPWLKHKKYPLLIEPVRDALVALGKPWVIENVADAPMPLHGAGVLLCGTMFNLLCFRHRRFETSFLSFQPPHRKHRRVIGTGALLESRRAIGLDGFVSVIGKAKRSVIEAAKEAMGLDWMHDPVEVSQAIPPAYSHFLGLQLFAAITGGATL